VASQHVPKLLRKSLAPPQVWEMASSREVAAIGDVLFLFGNAQGRHPLEQESPEPRVELHSRKCPKVNRLSAGFSGTIAHRPQCSISMRSKTSAVRLPSRKTPSNSKTSCLQALSVRNFRRPGFLHAVQVLLHQQTGTKENELPLAVVLILPPYENEGS
jgi:hypothetical protein